MARVFLSYARDDAELAEKLAAANFSGGASGLVGPRDQGGSRFSSEIDKALQDADAVLVLWSEASVKSALGTG